MRILVACGGTGGHFYPGYSAALELRKQGAETLFLVRRGDAAARVLRDGCLPYAELELTGLPRSLNPFRHAAFAMKLGGALLQARRVVKDWRPDAVFGTGGYISFPAVFWAALSGIPALVHESNAIPGLANLLLARLGAKVAAGLPVRGFPAKTEITLTGTPIREFFASAPDRARARAAFGLLADRPVILCFGGSGGAIGLNTALSKSAAGAQWKDVQLLHITGRRDFAKISRAYGTLPPNVKLLEYSDRMDLAYAAADLLLCRSGASTVAELLALKKPAILVPFPEAAADHQTENAKVLVQAGAALLLPETPGLAEKLSATVPALAKDASRLSAMSAAYDSLQIPSPLKSGALLAGVLRKLASA